MFLAMFIHVIDVLGQAQTEAAPIILPQPDPAPGNDSWVPYVLTVILIVAVFLTNIVNTKKHHKI